LIVDVFPHGAGALAFRILAKTLSSVVRMWASIRRKAPFSDRRFS